MRLEGARRRAAIARRRNLRRSRTEVSPLRLSRPRDIGRADLLGAKNAGIDWRMSSLTVCYDSPLTARQLVDENAIAFFAAHGLFGDADDSHDVIDLRRQRALQAAKKRRRSSVPAFPRRRPASSATRGSARSLRHLGHCAVSIFRRPKALPFPTGSVDGQLTCQRGAGAAEKDRGERKPRKEPICVHRVRSGLHAPPGAARVATRRVRRRRDRENEISVRDRHRRRCPNTIPDAGAVVTVGA